MKRLTFSIVTLAVLSAIVAFTLPPINWKIADKYNISFSTNGVSGIFKKFSGNIIFDDKNPGASKFDVSIDVNSINTGNGMQNKHAKSADWFDAARYPSIQFTSKKIIRTAAVYQVIGDLKLHGISKELTIPFKFSSTENGGMFTGSFTVNRNDFKIGKAGGEVGDIIKLNVSVPVTK
jgi:polyisoprenoid-binding protein YceI